MPRSTIVKAVLPPIFVIEGWRLLYRRIQVHGSHRWKQRSINVAYSSNIICTYVSSKILQGS